MADGKMEGMFVMGQNPAVAGQTRGSQRSALSKLKWLVVRDMVEIEAARFGVSRRRLNAANLKTEEIETEVFLFSVGGHAENGRHLHDIRNGSAVAPDTQSTRQVTAIGRVVHASACLAFDRQSEEIERSHGRTATRSRLVVPGGNDGRTRNGSGAGEINGWYSCSAAQRVTE
jgi:hypothetical protein